METRTLSGISEARQPNKEEQSWWDKLVGSFNDNSTGRDYDVNLYFNLENVLENLSEEELDYLNSKRGRLPIPDDHIEEKVSTFLKEKTTPETLKFINEMMKGKKDFEDATKRFSHSTMVSKYKR
jgi:hypothetical protein